MATPIKYPNPAKLLQFLRQQTHGNTLQAYTLAEDGTVKPCTVDLSLPLELRLVAPVPDTLKCSYALKNYLEHLETVDVPVEDITTLAAILEPGTDSTDGEKKATFTKKRK